MKERPIIFSAPMIHALLAGTKAQTRRIMKPQMVYGNVCGIFDSWYLPKGNDGGILWPNAKNRILSMCPYGVPGDRLWVRETWQHSNHPLGPYEADCSVFYRADYLDDAHGPDGELSPEGKYRKWRSPIHMPRTASRITLEVTEVRVERLQDISDEDAIAEGVDRTNTSIQGYARERFFRLWESINGRNLWDENPYVWVISFRRAA